MGLAPANLGSTTQNAGPSTTPGIHVPPSDQRTNMELPLHDTNQFTFPIHSYPTPVTGGLVVGKESAHSAGQTGGIVAMDTESLHTT